MSEYLVRKESLTAIADEVRELSDVTGTMSLGAMVTNLSDINDEVDVQAALLTQIADALEGKALGGENNNSGVITITNNLDAIMFVGGLLLFPGETGTVPIGSYGNPYIPVSINTNEYDSVIVAVNGYNPNEDWNYSYEATYDIVADQDQSCGFFIRDISGFFDGYTFVIRAN